MKIKCSLVTSILTLFLFICNALHSQAQVMPFSIDTGDGDGADTWAGQKDGGTNYGTEGSVRINNDGAGSTRGIGYFRFDLDGIDVSTISDASFQFRFNVNNDGQAPGSFELYGLVDSTAADARPGSGGWGETTLTDSNAPARTGTTGITTDMNNPTGNPSGYAILIGGFSITAGGWQDDTSFSIGAVNSSSNGGASFDAGIGANMASFLQADTNGVVTFALRQSSTNNRQMFVLSKENLANTPPLLVFDAQLIPEPSSVLLLMCGLGALLGARRRR